MATKPQHISDVYASQLEEFREGHPLWSPEGPIGADEISIGDVGYLQEGQFIELFKARYSKDDPENTKNRDGERIPPIHEPLPKRAYKTVHSTCKLLPKMYTTKSMKHTEIKPGISAGAPTIAGAKLAYSLSTTEEKAAFLCITYPAYQYTAENSKAFRDYIKQYYSSWVEHAKNVLGIDIRGRDIVLVHGFLKTVEWIVGASRGGYVEQGGCLELQGGADPVLVGGISLELKQAITKNPSMMYLCGPGYRFPHSRSPSPFFPTSSRDSVTADTPYSNSSLDIPPSLKQVPISRASESAEDPKYDQCIFLRYFKVKWRIGSYLHIKAGAGPHQLPQDPDASAGERRGAVAITDSGDESDVETNIAPQPAYTWLDILLEYLLQHSNARIAIACHGDIYSLIPKEDIVEDFAAYLEFTRPKIDVDEEQVATLDLVDLVLKQHEREMRTTHPPITDKDFYDMVIDDGDPDDDEEKDENWRGGDGEISDGQLLLGHPPVRHKWLHYSFSGKDGDAGYITSLTLSPDGSIVAVGCLDGTTQLLRSVTGQLIRVLDGHHSEAVWSLAFSPDGKLMASGDTEGTILVRAGNVIPHLASAFAQSVMLGDVLFNLEGHSSDVTALAFSPDGKWVASGSIDCTSKLWSISLEGHQGAFPVVVQAHHTLDSLSAHVSNVAFTPDSKRLAISGDTMVKVWNVETGAPIASMSGHTAPIWSLALSHDGERLATGSEDHTSRIWATGTGDALVIIAEQGGPVWSVAWSEDDRYVASGSYDSTAVVCDSYTGEVLRQFKEPTSGATPVVWLTSDIICTGTADGPIKLWDLTSGETLAQLHGHGDKIKELLFARDGRDVVSYSDDGSVRIWNVSDVLRLV